MASSLSAYWVKFFKGAGFPLDVATKHAVIFSNNRIKPDMLPDLDKSSLREMGITLMGDMIAILRYAKKVVEETTCEKFLVDTEDVVGTPEAAVKKTVMATKTPIKTVIPKGKSDSVSVKKIVKVPGSTAKKVINVKKPVSSLRQISTSFDTAKKQGILKRKLGDTELENNIEDGWAEKSTKIKSIECIDDKVGYTVVFPKGSSSGCNQVSKKSLEQKRTVFDRLGDSSVTSTTNPAETSPTFNITGLGKDVYKRSASVFNRLGDKDGKKESTMQTGILKNEISSTGILKTKSPSTRTSILTTSKVATKNVGTMRADQEESRKVIANNVSHLGKGTRRITFGNLSARESMMAKPNVVSGKLASERPCSLPAKARLGMSKMNSTKQVTFDRITTITRVKKPDVFSRLGV